MGGGPAGPELAAAPHRFVAVNLLMPLVRHRLLHGSDSAEDDIGHTGTPGRDWSVAEV